MSELNSVVPAPQAMSEGAFRMGARAMCNAIRDRLAELSMAASAGIASDQPIPTFPAPPPAKSTDWAWWSGPDDEYYRNGPFATREEALVELDEEGGYIIEAQMNAVTFSADMLINNQYFEDEGFDFDNCEPDRIGGADAIGAADAELQALLDGWLDRWRHTFVAPNMFAGSRNGECVAGVAEATPAEEQAWAEGERP